MVTCAWSSSSYARSSTPCWLPSPTPTDPRRPAAGERDTLGPRRLPKRRIALDCEDVMAHDLVIKNGMVVDGSGFSRYRADVAVKDGTIVEIGRVTGAAEKTIDADGRFVAPGIIDLHT